MAEPVDRNLRAARPSGLTSPGPVRSTTPEGTPPQTPPQEPPDMLQNRQQQDKDARKRLVEERANNRRTRQLAGGSRLSGRPTELVEEPWYAWSVAAQQVCRVLDVAAGGGVDAGGVVAVGAPDVLDVLLGVFAPCGVPPVGAGQFGTVKQGRGTGQEDLDQVVGEAEVAGECDRQAEEEPGDAGGQDRGAVGWSRRPQIMLIRWQSSTSPGQGVSPRSMLYQSR
jgi:hypothetical protein